MYQVCWDCIKQVISDRIGFVSRMIECCINYDWVVSSRIEVYKVELGLYQIVQGCNKQDWTGLYQIGLGLGCIRQDLGCFKQGWDCIKQIGLFQVGLGCIKSRIGLYQVGQGCFKQDCGYFSRIVDISVGLVFRIQYDGFMSNLIP